MYTKLYNKDYAYHTEMTEFVQLNRKIPNSRNRDTTATSSSTSSSSIIVPKIPPPLSLPQSQSAPLMIETTTDNTYQQNTLNSYPAFDHEALTTVATMQTKSTISTTQAATQTVAMTFIPATEQLQITKQLNVYEDTTDFNTAVKAKRKIRGQPETEKQEVVFHKIYNSLEEEAATSRTTTTNNYVADKSYFFVPPTMLRIGPTMRPFVTAVTIGNTRRQKNDYGSGSKRSRIKNHSKNTIYRTVTVDLKPNRRQKQLKQVSQQQHYEHTIDSKSKLQNSESGNDCINISNSSKQKATNTLSCSHTNRYGTININSNNTGASIITARNSTTIKALTQQHNQHQKYLKAKKETGTRTRTRTRTFALDAATAINSLPSNATTDFSENSRHNLSNHHSNYNYNHISTSNGTVSNISPTEITQFPNESYQMQKRATSTHLALHHYELPYNQLGRPVLLHRHGRQAPAEEEQSEKCRMFIEGDPEKNELYSPEYPNDYPKNINCTRVITGMYVYVRCCNKCLAQ